MDLESIPLASSDHPHPARPIRTLPSTVVEFRLLSAVVDAGTHELQDALRDQLKRAEERPSESTHSLARLETPAPVFPRPRRSQRVIGGRGTVVSPWMVARSHFDAKIEGTELFIAQEPSQMPTKGLVSEQMTFFRSRATLAASTRVVDPLSCIRTKKRSNDGRPGRGDPERGRRTTNAKLNHKSLSLRSRIVLSDLDHLEQHPVAGDIAHQAWSRIIRIHLHGRAEMDRAASPSQRLCMRSLRPEVAMLMRKSRTRSAKLNHTLLFAPPPHTTRTPHPNQPSSNSANAHRRTLVPTARTSAAPAPASLAVPHPNPHTRTYVFSSNLSVGGTTSQRRWQRGEKRQHERRSKPYHSPHIASGSRSATRCVRAISYPSTHSIALGGSDLHQLGVELCSLYLIPTSASFIEDISTDVVDMQQGSLETMDLTDVVVDWTRNEICDWDNLVHLAFQRYWARVDVSSCGSGSIAEPPMDTVAASRLVCDTAVGDLAALPVRCWYSIPFVLRRKIDVEAAPGAATEDIDSWIYLSERYLEANASFRETGVGRGLVSLEELAHVFPLVSQPGNMRIVPRLRDLPGNYPFGQAESASTGLVQHSSDAFAEMFDILTGGILRGLQWGNICAAGGAVLEALQTGAVEGGGRRPPSESDVDLFLYNVTPDTAESKIRSIYSTIRNNLPEGTETLIVRSSRAVTFYTPYPARRIQVVLRTGCSIRNVLHCFDLDICALAWDGTTVWMLPRAARALETGFNSLRVEMLPGRFQNAATTSSMERILKYATRGYPLRILPAYVNSLPPRVRLDRITLRQRTLVDERQKAYNLPHTKQTTPMDYRRLNVSNGLRSFATLAQFSRLWTIRNEQRSRFPWGPAVALTAIEKIVSTLNASKNKSAMDAVTQICIAGFGVTLDPNMRSLVEDRLLGCSPVLASKMYGEVLDKSAAVSWGLVIPDSLAAFANEVITEVQVDRGLRIETTVLPIRGQSGERVLLTGRGLQPYVWTIPSSLMLWNWDRRLDE
ncbi:hypothetical protein HMN09_01416300 [Mycena chlorophos]|uniref:Uncharacterized protein n=1 Tax=Mycena chlorophos TaxID=658473 RepID=A0A8H6VU06_MYCCL|nr:hypothetical protein HMN09_01416300 [Mycena chlorophos]